MSIMNKSLAALALSLCITTAQATVVSFTLTGDITYADSGNGFGLTTTDFVTVSGTFEDDNNVLLGGVGTVYFDGSVPGNTFTINAGNYKYYNTDDDLYGFGTPNLVFNGDPIPFLDFWHSGSTVFFTSYNPDPPSGPAAFFDGDDGTAAIGTMSGKWTQFEMTAVPVPAAVWLLGSGLLGLVGVTRRKVSV